MFVEIQYYNIFYEKCWNTCETNVICRRVYVIPQKWATKRSVTPTISYATAKKIVDYYKNVIYGSI